PKPGSDRIESRKGMVVSASRQASEWGAEILKNGGNAMDAAVGAAWMLAVVYPEAGSIGGGGFLIYCGPRAKNCESLDYRERAPGKSRREMYKSGASSIDGPLAAGIPGVVAGLLEAQREHGKMPSAWVLSQPIRVAREGFQVDAGL